MTSTHFRTNRTIPVLALLCGWEGLALAQTPPAQHAPPSPTSKAMDGGGAHRQPHALSVPFPLAFETSLGQQGRSDNFLAQGPGYRLTLSPRAATFQMATSSKPAHGKRTLSIGALLPTETLAMQLVGTDASAHAVQKMPPTGHANYFLGQDRSKWRTEVPLYSRVQYDQVYPGIDLVYYGNQRQLEYDFLVRPHTDPKRIGLKFGGARKVRIAANGDLILAMKQGEVRWRKPVSYQTIGGKKRTVASAFVQKKDGEIGFALAHYDTSHVLTIDPQLIYSTFLGGSTEESAYALALDSVGNTYITGQTYSADFPVTPGAFQTQAGGLAQGTAFIAKLNPAGTALLYATYLGGTGSDRGDSIAVDSQGNAYIAGLANSIDFPVTPGAFQTVNHKSTMPVEEGFSANAFVTKLNSTGSALVYSTYLGGHTGPSASDIASGIAIDSQGNAFVTGSADSADFPTTPGAFQQTNPVTTSVTPPLSGFVTELNSTGTALIYSTYLGGSKGGSCNAIAVDSSDNAYVTGGTVSQDYPTTANAFQKTNNVTGSGFRTAFVTKLNVSGTALVYSTYLGGSGQYGETAYGIAVDGSGSAYVTGQTSSTDFPTTPGAIHYPRTAGVNQPTHVFVTKLNAAGSALTYSADIGDGGGNSIAVDAAGNAAITGQAITGKYPTTIGAYLRPSSPAVIVTFVTRLNTTGTALLYSTFFGGKNSYGSGIALDSFGNVTICGDAYDAGYPVTSNAFQQTYRISTNTTTGFVTRLSTHPIFPDFNNDGHTDLLLRNRTTGALTSWFMNGSNILGGAAFSLIPPATYTPVGIGDFTGNGAATLTFQNSADNRVVFWYTGGINYGHISGGDYVNQTPEAGWKLMSIADFNQDGLSDLLFQNQTTGQVALWYLSGPYFQGGVTLPQSPGAGWQVVGTGDFNADGFPDIVFQNQTTGALKIWFMQGPAFASEAAVTTTPISGWKVVGVGDYNGDGMADLVFQNQTTNQCVVWYMNGALYQGGSSFSQYPLPDWKVFGPR